MKRWFAPTQQQSNKVMDMHSPLRTDHLPFNEITLEALAAHGLSDRSGLMIVTGGFIGKTLRRDYLQGLTEGRYVVADQPETFTATRFDEGDHDVRYHFPRLPQIHPDMLPAVGSFAGHILDLDTDDSNDRRIKPLLEDVDLFLSIYHYKNPQILIRVAEQHVARLFDYQLGATDFELQECVEKLVETQTDYENNVEAMVLPTV